MKTGEDRNEAGTNNFSEDLNLCISHPSKERNNISFIFDMMQICNFKQNVLSTGLN